MEKEKKEKHMETIVVLCLLWEQKTWVSLNADLHSHTHVMILFKWKFVLPSQVGETAIKIMDTIYITTTDRLTAARVQVSWR